MNPPLKIGARLINPALTPPSPRQKLQKIRDKSRTAGFVTDLGESLRIFNTHSSLK